MPEENWRGDLGAGVDVADVGGDAGCAGDIVEGEGGDEGVKLHEEGEGLADAAGGAEDGDLALGAGLDSEAPAGEVGGSGASFSEGGLHRSEKEHSHLFFVL